MSTLWVFLRIKGDEKMMPSDIFKLCRRFGVPYVYSGGTLARPKGSINPVLMQCLIKAVENDGFLSRTGFCIKLKRNELIGRLRRYESS